MIRKLDQDLLDQLESLGVLLVLVEGQDLAELFCLEGREVAVLTGLRRTVGTVHGGGGRRGDCSRGGGGGLATGRHDWQVEKESEGRESGRSNGAKEERGELDSGKS